MRVLLTGGAGYIGSHTAVELLNQGHQVISVDNYSNSSPEALRRVQIITGKELSAYDCDLREEEQLDQILSEEAPVDCVIHFAGYKAVGESVREPLKYYENNLEATLALVKAMRRHDVSNLVFSSSATVYGEENPYPYVETMTKGQCTNPYGWTKWIIEQILTDTAAACPDFSVVLLRYFNPVGAHESGMIGEDPTGIPNNLMPYITQVASGLRDKLTIFGKDYDTPDGTCQRDFIHVMDLAEAHVAAVKYLEAHVGLDVFNIGTGQPYSVLDLVTTFQKVNNLTIAYEFGGRRAGDLDKYWADASKARDVLGWSAHRTLGDMCADSWNWQKQNPEGYGSK